MEKIKQKTTVLFVVLAVCAFAVLAWALTGCDFSKSKQDVKDTGDFAQAQRLEGRWVRPDGGYTLVIEDVKPDGSLKASYYNPRTINVHEVNWKVEKNGVHLFVELRDVNYPGSKYSLIYIDEEDVLSGTYFQAVHKQTYDVKFIRMLEGQIK